MQLSPHFTLAEMTKSQAAIRHGIANEADDLVTARLKRWCENIGEPLRAHFGRPITVNSGYRSRELNTLINGSPTSQHCLGEAVDLEIAGVSNLDIAKFIASGGLAAGFDQLILEAHTPGLPSSGWVHVSWSARRLRKQVLTMQVRHARATYLQGLVA